MKPIKKTPAGKTQYKANNNDHNLDAEKQKIQDSEDTSCMYRFFKSIKNFYKELSKIPPEPNTDFYPF